MSGMSGGKVDALLAGATIQGVCPGGVLVVADGGQVVHRRAFGVRAWVDGLGRGVDGDPVREDTIYDLASLTKPLVTSTLAARLVEAGRLSFDSPVCAFLPELRDPAIRVRDLLAHAAGFPAWIPLWKELRREDPRDKMLALAAAVPPDAKPGERAVYSDIGFILLGFALERASGMRLDDLAGRALFEPLGARASFVDLRAPSTLPPALVAPTELTADRGLVHGQVHDENCWWAGGILGHAGLFGAADDVSIIVSALVRSWHGERFPGAFPREIVRELWRPSGVPGSTWRLGWDGPATTGVSSAGTRWPRDGVGHLGFTGTSIWIDPPRARWVVLLTNRVHPTRANQAIRELRPRVHDLVVEALDGP